MAEVNRGHERQRPNVAWTSVICQAFTDLLLNLEVIPKD